MLTRMMLSVSVIIVMDGAYWCSIRIPFAGLSGSSGWRGDIGEMLDAYAGWKDWNRHVSALSLVSSLRSAFLVSENALVPSPPTDEPLTNDEQ